MFSILNCDYKDTEKPDGKSEPPETLSIFEGYITD